MKNKFYKIIFLLYLYILNNNASNVFMNWIHGINKETVISHLKVHGMLEATCILPILMNLRQLNQNTSKESSGEDSEKTTFTRFIQFTQSTPLRILTRKEPSSLIETLLEAFCLYGFVYSGCKYTGITKKFEGMTTQISKSLHHPTEIILGTFSIIHALAKSCSNKNTTIAIEEDRESRSKGGESKEKKHHKSISPPIHSAGNPHAERKEVKSPGDDKEKKPANLEEVVDSQSDLKNKGEEKKPASEIFIPVDELYSENSIKKEEEPIVNNAAIKEINAQPSIHSDYDSGTGKRDKNAKANQDSQSNTSAKLKFEEQVPIESANSDEPTKNSIKKEEEELHLNINDKATNNNSHHVQTLILTDHEYNQEISPSDLTKNGTEVLSKKNQQETNSHGCLRRIFSCLLPNNDIEKENNNDSNDSEESFVGVIFL